MRAALAAEAISDGAAQFPDSAAEPPDSATVDQDLPSAANSDLGPGGGCVMCAKMEQTLDEQLRHRQFLLATRESDQSRHAQAGGYCSLHTWQYASIASPLGISAGYAGLAAAIADALESASEQGQSPADLSRTVAALTPGSGECLLCQVLAARELAAVAEVVSSETAAAVCLRHLGLVLAAGPAPEAGQTMLRAVTARLRRDSDDMRDYALKREALHRSLITAEESRAYLNALRQLAGPPALTLPRTDTGF